MSSDDNPYEASDEASENELLNESLSVWKGSWTFAIESREDFIPIPLDLHTACSLGQYDCVRNKIQRNEDVNKMNKGGWSPLMYACYIGHDNIVNLLLDAKVNVNSRNKKGRTPLMLAASCGNESVSYFLMQQGAELESTDNRGWTALFHATFAGHMNVVKFFLENGANMDAEEPGSGFTPFLEAASEGHEIIVQYFLQHGVNINHKSRDGFTARSLAMCNGHMKIVSLVDNHNMSPSTLRSDAGLGDYDLSSSDEAFQGPRSHHSASRSKSKNKGPSIRDGPEAFQKLMDKSQSPQHSPHHSPHHAPANRRKYDPRVPTGYVTFQETPNTSEQSEVRLRDVVSPISPEDHHLDSSGGRSSHSEAEDGEANAFSLTGALTIKSSSSSSGGLAAAFGINHDESTDESVFDSNVDGAANSSYKAPREHKQLKKEKRSPKVTIVDQNVKTNADMPNMLSVDNRLHPKEQILKVVTQPAVATVAQSSPKEQCNFSPNQPEEDIPVVEVLEKLGLTKYMKVFEEQDIDFQVFLSLTDNDLKEIGIKLFGPRRKMTNYIARWHSKARPSCSDLEQAYADRLEAEMQEMAIQLAKASTQMEQLKVQASQERELRSVAEGCLMDTRATYQQIQRIGAEIKKRCNESQEALCKAGLVEAELRSRLETKRLMELPSPKTRGNSLSNAIKQGMNIHEDTTLATSNSINDMTIDQLMQIMSASLEDIQRSVAITSLDTDRLVSRGNMQYNNSIDYN